MISKSCLDFDSAKGNWVCLSEHAMKRWEIDDLMIANLLSGFLAKYLMLIRLAQETRSTTPVGAVSNRTDAHT